MAQVVESPVSVRLPKYIIKKIDELVKEGEFKSRSDFIKYAVTLTLGQIMIEKAREKAKTITPEEAKARSRQAFQKLFTEEIEDEWSEIKDILKEVGRRHLSTRHKKK
ncbi:ribbon-helix-helix domain-containing protein [Thermococcus barophilus]|uniref:Putative Programmed cell death antitoxin YdcD-like protein n=1 Tax=Thermococcus barophilus TaxID=55802 RepID=A0A0S1X8I4_THEBA|nr:type II toxin-antitoxin system ParD family antitoxin [Thermococcus barophilus]ALM74075.1 putative Programmed cell death antitoxin YdcD-like protein [Thermococcus barophilus]